MQRMRMPAWVCTECKCLFESMPWCECPLGSMPWRECPLIGMQWMQMPPCRYDSECFGANTIYSKIPFIFKTRLPQRLKPKYSQKLDLLFMKSHLLFDLKLPKDWWSLLEISEWGIDLESDDLAQDLFSQFGWAKRWCISKAFFLEKWILWKSSILKRFIFVVPEYGNLTSVKTHLIDSRIQGRAFWNEKFKFLVLERVKDLIEDSDAVWSLPFHSSICFAYETSEIFSFLL